MCDYLKKTGGRKVYELGYGGWVCFVNVESLNQLIGLPPT